MSAADEIISDLPMDQLAARLGTDPATAEQAVRAALPALIGGMQTNVTSDSAGPASLAEALGQHADSAVLDGGVNLDAVDTGDGDAIVQHIFANSPEQAELLRAKAGGVGGDIISKLLPILAPIVMAYLAKKLGMGKGGDQGNQSGQSGTGGLGDLLGPILGGLFPGGSSGSAGGGLGDILGQILKGQAPQSAPQEQTAPADQSGAQPTTQQTQPSGGTQFNPPQGGNDTGVRMPTSSEDPTNR